MLHATLCPAARTDLQRGDANGQCTQVLVRDEEGTHQKSQKHMWCRFLVTEARALGVEIIDRCNLTVLQEPGQEDLVEFLAANQVKPSYPHALS